MKKEEKIETWIMVITLILFWAAIFSLAFAPTK